VRKVLLAVGLCAALFAAPAGAGEGQPDPRNVAPEVPAGLAGALASDFPSFAFISTGLVRLGLNPEGHVDAWSGTESLGLQYVPTGGDALIPGCWCEGWGIHDLRSGVAGWASVPNGGISSNLVVQEFDVTATTARSVVEIAGRLRVTHDYRPSGDLRLFEVRVHVENIGATDASLVGSAHEALFLFRR
jgi:hypothetical protein